ncbi:MAG: STAS domain-containing protein [Lachnospiraceae bacterium]|jgi:anti-sigma B factor antagonist|nr:STAS domain-containing protein [Lachnospiraceae bacterium]MBR4753844.1 STAS domain-containing protein [Lachnospiraceae bacterium]MBR4807337.1 STAS domain-containing protein [Lachnospiraceae bacterium]
MDINKKVNGEALEIALTGRLDTTTAPQLDEVVKNDLNGITSLVFDLNSLEYISSAGLRVLLAAQKVMNKQGSMVVRNVKDDIMEVFDITGFADILTVE